MTNPSRLRAFFARLDADQVATGDRLLEPTNPNFMNGNPAAYNCFSYALTQAQGDVGSPFTDATTPRWVHSPLFELTNGNWQRLAPDQRAQVGDRLVYRNNGAITHASKVVAVDAAGNPARVESKFGEWGLFEMTPSTCRS